MEAHTQNPDIAMPAATVQLRVEVCVYVSGTSASPGMAGCLSVSLLRGDQGHNKLAH